MTKNRNEILKEVLWAAELEEIRRIDSLPRVKYDPSEKYTEFLEKLFKESKKDDEQRTVLKKRKIILIAAIVALLALTITACSVITPVREFIIEVFEKYTLFTSTPSDESDFIEVRYGISFIPEGYEMSECIDESSIKITTYQNNEKTIQFNQSILSGIIHIDSEGVETIELDIGEKHIYLFTKWKDDQVVWSDEKYLFTISYPEELDFSEVEKMIRSVAPIGE